MQNVRGLRTKLKNLEVSVEKQEYDIIVLVETWLNDDIFDGELGMTNFIIYRCDRSKATSDCDRGGGVMIAVRSNYTSKRIISKLGNIEHIFVIVTIDRMKILICAAYLPPQLSINHYESLSLTIEEIYDTSGCNYMILCGDFNLPGEYWNDSGCFVQGQGSVSHQARCISDMATYLNLKQYNNIPNSHGRFLDLIFSDYDHISVATAEVPLLNCDAYHPALKCELSLNFENGGTADFDYEYFDFKNANFHNLNYFMGSPDWDALLDLNNIDLILDTFYGFIYEAFHCCVPMRRSRKPKFPLWYSNELKNLIFGKKIAHKKFKESGSQKSYEFFSQLRSQCKEMSILCYQEYINNMESAMKNDSSSFWNFVNSRSGNYDLPGCMIYNEQSSENTLQIANFFADFFSSVYNENTGCDIDFKDTHNVSLGAIKISEMEVFNAISNLSDNLSMGPDNVSVLFLKSCKYILSHVLCLIFNRSLSLGKFPAFWKLTYITPLFKNGARSDIVNYRPISKFSLVSKVFELIVNEKLTHHLSGMIMESQHGFIKNRSTVSNLLVYEEFLVESLESFQQVDAVYTDFRKAFDTVIHGNLINKLRAAGIFGSMLHWVEDYLCNRRQIVKLKNVCSREILVTSGVPQGSHLSPLLFNVFINDIREYIKYSESLSYADDLKFFKDVTSVEDCQKIQKDIDGLVLWCQINGMQLNVTKCKTISFSKKKNLINFEYKANSVPLEKVNTIKDLGVIFDQELTFTDHIDYITNKALKTLGFLKRSLRDFSDLLCFKTLYCAYIRSTLEYASQVWSPYYNININRLERVQRKFLRFCAYKMSIPSDHIIYSEIQRQLNLPSLEQRRKFIDMNTIYKIINCDIDCSPLLSMILINVPQRCLRNYDLFKIIHHRTNYGRSSFVNRSCELCNVYCSDVDLFNSSLPQLKTAMKNRLFHWDVSMP